MIKDQRGCGLHQRCILQLSDSVFHLPAIADSYGTNYGKKYKIHKGKKGTDMHVGIDLSRFKSLLYQNISRM